MQTVYQEFWTYVKRFGLVEFFTNQYHHHDCDLKHNTQWKNMILNYYEYTMTPKSWFESRPSMQYSTYSPGEFEYEDLCIHFENHLALLFKERGINDKPDIAKALTYIKQEYPEQFKQDILSIVRTNNIVEYLKENVNIFLKYDNTKEELLTAEINKFN